MNAWKVSVLLTTLALASCNTAPAATTDADSRSTDAAVDAPTTGGDGGSSSCQMPELTNLCSMEGCHFAPITLPSCAQEGGEVVFYDQQFCSVEATLVVIAAGWCVPCQIEAPMIEELITSAPEYQGRVRVITVISQNADYSPPTPAFCRSWQNRYGLTSIMAYDPMGLTQRYFPNMAYPANLIVDRRGRIRYRTYGTSRGLNELRAALDEVLANP